MSDQPIIFHPQRPPFSTIEKASLLLLIVAGIGGVFFGAKYLGKNLVSPFEIAVDESYELKANKAEAERAAMKSRDTDGDTINDYDEQYVYETSPYLADSDSDGFADAQEIESGNDPNCPAGRVCGSLTSGEEAVDLGEQVASGLDAPEGDLDTFEALLEQAQTEEPTDPMAALANLTPSQLRELLIQNGVDEQAIAEISDEDLLALYQELLAQYAAE